jgi:uncharacterized protein (DUF2062 family)
VRAWLRRWWGRAVALWHRAKNEYATPREIGVAFAMGAFVSCTPLIGFHVWIALGLATVFRLNRLFAFLGSRVGNSLILAWVVLAEIEIAHRLRTGAFIPLTARDALAQGPSLLLDWCLGTIPVGAAVALVVGALAYAVARLRDARVRRRTLAEPPAPSSESPL